MIIGEFSPRRSRGEYSPIITEPEANNCFSIFTQVFCVFWDRIYFNFAYFFISNFHKKAIYYTSNSNCPIRKLSLCHVSMKLNAILRLTSSISEPAFLLTMCHPVIYTMFPGGTWHGWNSIRVDHARQHE